MYFLREFSSLFFLPTIYDYILGFRHPKWDQLREAVNMLKIKEL
jgi:hypothetical protein